VIDLHAHSSCSDGSETPEEVVRIAIAAGLGALALADHDTLAGIERARAASAQSALIVVPAVELSTTLAGTWSMHLLVYFVDDPTSPLGCRLVELQHARMERNRAMVERLRSLGLPIDYDSVVDHANGNERGVGRPHMASVLVERGAASSIADAFGRWLGSGAPGYVARQQIDTVEAIELAHASGGLAVVAHPDRTGLDEARLRHELARLADAGLDGLEAYYGGSSPERRAELAALARDLGLVATGGSDYHGRFKPGLDLGTGFGDLSVGDAVLCDLAARLDDRARRPDGLATH